MSAPFEDIAGVQPLEAILQTDGGGRVLRAHAGGARDAVVTAECVDTVASALSALGASLELGDLRGGVISFAHGHLALGSLGQDGNVGLVAGEDAKVGLLLHQLRELVEALGAA